MNGHVEFIPRRRTRVFYQIFKAHNGRFVDEPYWTANLQYMVVRIEAPDLPALLAAYKEARLPIVEKPYRKPSVWRRLVNRVKLLLRKE